MNKETITKYKELKEERRKLEEAQRDEVIEYAVSGAKESKDATKYLLSEAELKRSIKELEAKIYVWLDGLKDEEAKNALRFHILRGEDLDTSCRISANKSNKEQVKLKVANILSNLK